MNKKITEFFFKRDDSGYQSNEASPCCDPSVIKSTSTPKFPVEGDRSNNPEKRSLEYDDADQDSDVDLQASDNESEDTGESGREESGENGDYENRDAHESEWDEGESQFDNERELSDCSSVIEIDGDNYENQSSGKNGDLDNELELSNAEISNDERENCMKENNGPRQLPEKRQIQVKLDKNADHFTMCETNCQETTLSMVKAISKNHKKIRKKAETSCLIFKNIRTGSALNLGLPTGSLKESEQYQCIFKKSLSFDTEKMIREFDVELYTDEWDLKSFCVAIDKDKESKPCASKLFRATDIIEVAFFKGESFYEALSRDKRFDVEKSGQLVISNCDLMELGTTVNRVVPLGNEATMYDGKTFELCEAEGEGITTKVPPLKYPPFLQKIKTSTSDANSETLVNTNDAQDATAPETLIQSSTHVRKLIIARTDEELKVLIENNFGIKVTKERKTKEESKRLSKIKKFVKTGYDNFALNRKYELSFSELKKLCQLCESTGAIVMKLSSGQQMFIGTCFRLGPRYVITNYHVYKMIEDREGMLEEVIADFSYTGNSCISNYFSIISDIIIIKSVELDYAILEVEGNAGRLPVSVTSFFTVPPVVKSLQEGVFLTFSGHPNGSNETMTNLFSPLKCLETLDERVVIGLSRNEHKQLLDQRRQLYDVSTFFHGSSGSPGVLLQEGFLLVLHCGQYPLNDGQGGAIEQGVLMAAVVEDVKKERADLVDDIFDLPKAMEVDN